MIEGAEGMTHVLPEATGDPPHLLEQPSIVARCGGMIEPTGAPSSVTFSDKWRAFFSAMWRR